FYSVVSESLNDTLLTWRGIEATVQLAQSPNSKVVVVGSGRDQLPLILGSDIAAVPSTPQPVPPIGGDAGRLPDWTKLPNIFRDSGLDVLRQSTPDGENFLPEDKRALDEFRGDHAPSAGDSQIMGTGDTGTGLFPGLVAPPGTERLKPANQ
ncbi:MAG: hypothetical protein WD100_12675, partial [Tistlia sp.]